MSQVIGVIASAKARNLKAAGEGGMGTAENYCC